MEDRHADAAGDAARNHPLAMHPPVQLKVGPVAKRADKVEVHQFGGVYLGARFAPLALERQHPPILPRLAVALAVNGVEYGNPHAVLVGLAGADRKVVRPNGGVGVGRLAARRRVLRGRRQGMGNVLVLKILGHPPADGRRRRPHRGGRQTTFGRAEPGSPHGRLPCYSADLAGLSRTRHTPGHVVNGLPLCGSHQGKERRPAHLFLNFEQAQPPVKHLLRGAGIGGLLRQFGFNRFWNRRRHVLPVGPLAVRFPHPPLDLDGRDNDLFLLGVPLLVQLELSVEVEAADTTDPGDVREFLGGHLGQGRENGLGRHPQPGDHLDLLDRQDALRQMGRFPDRDHNFPGPIGRDKVAVPGPHFRQEGQSVLEALGREQRPIEAEFLPVLRRQHAPALAGLDGFNQVPEFCAGGRVAVPPHDTKRQRGQENHGRHQDHHLLKMPPQPGCPQVGCHP